MAVQAQQGGEAAVDRRVVVALENLLAEIQKAVRAVNFYPDGHPILGQIHQNSYSYVQKAARYFGELEIEVGRQNVTYKGIPLGPESEVSQALRQQLFKRRMKKLIILDGVEFGEFRTFVQAAALDPEEVYLRGGLDTILIEGKVRHIWSNQIDFDRLRRAGEEEEPEPEPEPQQSAAEVFLDSVSLDDELPEEALSPEEQALGKVLPLLDRTQDPEKYFEGMVLLANLAQRFVTARNWGRLFEIVSTLARHSNDAERGVELKKYSYRALRKIGTPEVLRALLAELVTEGRNADDIDQILNVLGILSTSAAEAVVTRLGFVKDAYARKLLEQALYRIGPVATQRLYPLLGSEDADLLCLALRTLANYRDAEAVDRLVKLSTHADAEVRRERVRALLRIRTAAALNQLYDILLGTDDELRLRIIKAFGNSREVRSVPVLMNLVRSQKEFAVTPELRSETFLALGKIGGSEAATQLMDYLAEKRLWRHRHDEESLDEAMGALAEAGGTAELATLQQMRFKSDTLQSAQTAACRRISERLAGPTSAE